MKVRDAELEEIRDINKNLEVLLKEKEDCMNTQQENIKASIHNITLRINFKWEYLIKVLQIIHI